MPASSSNNSALDDARAGAEEIAAQTERSIQDLARRAEKAIQEGIDTLRNQSRGYVDTAADRFDTTQRYVVDKVHERPLTAALTALGVGVVVGLLLSSGRRN